MSQVIDRRQIDSRDLVLLVIVQDPLQTGGQRRAVFHIAVTAFQASDYGHLVIECDPSLAAVIDR